MKLFAYICLVMLPLTSLAQASRGTTDDLGKVILMPYVVDGAEPMPAAARNMLSNKLDRIATKAGMSGAFNSSFVLAVQSDVIEKTITSTAPPMHVYSVGMTFVVGDAMSGNKFATHYAEVKGVGQTPTKAWIQAAKNVRDNAEMQQFLERGRQAVVDFFNANCENIMTQAKNDATKNMYDKALYDLQTVPAAAQSCFDKAQALSLEIFQEKIDFECTKYLADAKSAWNATQDRAAASTVANYLAMINPGAACFGEVQAFQKQVADRVLELDGREWDFKLETEIGLEEKRIAAMRDVGVAYGNGQPDQEVTFVVAD